MKTKIKKASPVETEQARQHLNACLKTITKKQLINTVCTMSESVIRMTAECPDDNTSIALSAELVCSLLEKNNREAPKFPTRKVFGGEYIAETSAAFGNSKGLITEAPLEQRRRLKTMMVIDQSKRP